MLCGISVFLLVFHLAFCYVFCPAFFFLNVVEFMNFWITCFSCSSIFFFHNDYLQLQLNLWKGSFTHNDWKFFYNFYFLTFSLTVILCTNLHLYLVIFLIFIRCWIYFCFICWSDNRPILPILICMSVLIKRVYCMFYLVELVPFVALLF